MKEEAAEAAAIAAESKLKFIWFDGYMSGLAENMEEDPKNVGVLPVEPGDKVSTELEEEGAGEEAVC